MNYFKRALALVISAFLLMSVGPLAVSADAFGDVQAGSAVAEAVSNLATLGILEGYPDGTFKPDNQITRAEFAAVVTRFLNIDSAGDESIPSGFPDVDEQNHWAKKYIKLAADFNVVNGYEDGTFRPDNPVKYVEAVKMLVCALGYEPLAKQRMNADSLWFQGYLVIAAEKGILNKAPIDNNENPAPRGIVAILTNNALEVNVIVPVIGGGDKYVEGSPAKDNLEKKVVTGIIVGVYETGLDSSSSGLLENQIRVFISNSKGERIYKLEKGVSVSQYLGYRIEGYELEDKNDYNYPYLTNIRPSTVNNRIVSVKSELIAEPVTASRITYYADENASRTSIVSFNNLKVIYNGKAVNFDPDYFNNIKSGKIDFLFVDGSNMAGVAFISDYKIYVVNSVSTNGDAVTVYPKYGESSFELDPDDTNTILSVESKTGAKVLPTAIKAKDVLSVLRSDSHGGGITKVIVSTDKKTLARVTEIRGNGKEFELTIGNQRSFYKLSYPYADGLAAGRADTPEISLNDEITAYLDHEGKIAYIDETSVAESYTLGYLYNAAKLSDMQSDRTRLNMHMGVYTKAGVKSLYLARNVKIDGKTYSDADEALDAFAQSADLGREGRPFEGGASGRKYAQMIRYATNTAGNVTSIDFAELETTNTSDLKLSTPADPDNKMRYNSEKKQLEFESAGKPVSVNASTNVFFVPYDRTDTAAYSYTTANNLIDGKEYYGEIYNLNVGSMVAGHIVIFNNKTANKVTAESPVFVSGGTIAQSKADVWKISGWSAKTGQTVTLETLDESVLSGFAAGDIFQFETDSAGYVMSTVSLVKSKDVAGISPKADFGAARQARVRMRDLGDEESLAVMNEELVDEPMDESADFFTIFGTVVGLGDGRIRISPQLVIDNMDFPIATGETADFSFNQNTTIISCEKIGSTYRTQLVPFSNNAISDLYSKQTHDTVNLTDPDAPNYVSSADRERYYKKDVSKVFAYATKGNLNAVIVYTEN